MEEKARVSSESIIRTVCLTLALANQVLVAFGKSPIPITDNQVQVFVSTGLTIAAAVVAWWYNNSFTQKAIKADEYMKRLED